MRTSSKSLEKRPSAVLIIALVLACIAVLALGVHRATTDKGARRPLTIVTDEAASAVPGEDIDQGTAAASAGPTTVVDGVPMGYAPTAAGAEAAAVQFLLLSQSLVRMDDMAAARAQRTMATISASDRLVEDLLEKLTALRSGYRGGAVTYRVGPLASRVALAASDRATVDIWYVGVVSPPNLPPYEEWWTVRYELAWERGDWREQAENSTRGPRPITLPKAEPSGPGQLEAALAGFGAIGALR